MLLAPGLYLINLLFGNLHSPIMVKEKKKMKPEHLEAYHHLIKQLLTYPDQAAKILDGHPSLLDAQLLQVMQQVSDRMIVKGFPEKADFLKSLETQLEDELIPIVRRKPSKPWSKIDEFSQTEELSVPLIGNYQLRKSKGNESSINWKNEWQKLNWRAKKISSRENKERLNELKWEEFSRRSKWISLLILIAFVSLSGWLLFYRVSGGQLFLDRGQERLLYFSPSPEKLPIT